MTAPTRDALSRLPRRVLSSGRNRTKAEILLFDWEGALVVAKDFRGCGLFVRNSVGRFSIARECRAYETLAGLAGIPRLIGRIDAHAFAYGYIAGTPLPKFDRHSVPASFLRTLEKLLVAIHARGVAIADLHHRNVIVQEPSQEPALIDFSLALRQPSAWNLPGRWVFRQAQQLDRIAVARIRARYEAQPGLQNASPPGPQNAARRGNERVAPLGSDGAARLGSDGAEQWGTDGEAP